MNSIKTLKTVIFFSLICLFLSGCNGKLPGGDARKFPADPKRVEKPIRGSCFRFDDALKKAEVEFLIASSNELGEHHLM